MNRLLGLLAAWGTTTAVFVGCSQTPPPPTGDDDDDDDVVTCPGLVQCGTGCKNLISDVQNCGACGNVCPAAAPFCAGASCTANCTGTVCPSGACVNLLNDQTNCGTCGTVCSNGNVCTNGACACPAGTVQCGAACVAPGTCSGTGGTSGAGGATNGGAVNGGSGGAPQGGAGGAPQGGAPMGGTSGAGPTGGSGGMSGNPPGWWTHGSWHGCVWTGVDTVTGTTTTNMPRDFLTHMAGMGYCVEGSVHSSYESVALLGFNLNETPTGSAMQCAYNPATATAMGPPGVALTGTGVAINFTKSTASTLRIQIQGPNGATDANDRWCYGIVPAAGPVFAPFSMFNTKCWDGTGTVYSGQPISAISFLVPGTMGAPTPFSYCINGFATGMAASDAPTWGEGGGGPLMGTIGGPGGMNLDFQRVKVAKDGKSYIIQNNNWGNPNGSDQTIRYSDNSFTVTQSTGGPGGGGEPASFPSIFIGANGDVMNGTYSTRSDDHLPKQISAITSVQSTFRHNGTSGGLNAAYDIWFSDHMPTGARYDDAISGFIMLWLYDPPNYQPIGSVMRQANIGGRTWDVWVGPRQATGAMCEGSPCRADRPVVSYVATSPSGSFTGDLKPFFTDAAQHGIPATWYLTDVFAGFECWNGGDCVNKSVQEFTAVVAP